MITNDQGLGGAADKDNNGKEEPPFNFLQSYISLYKDTEVPPLFALWCGISGVSCCLGRSVWLDMGSYTIFPNLFIILVAGSGRHRKSTAINVIENILHDVKPSPNIIAQMITPEALIEAIRNTDDNGTILHDNCNGFVVADELSNFLNRKSYDAGLSHVLIPLYDCKNNFEYRTKTKGKVKLKNTCLGLLAASTPDWIRGAIPEESIGGGLTSRMIFVFAKGVMSPIPFPKFGDLERKIQADLTTRLSSISSLTGPMHLTDEAHQTHIHEYNKFYNSSPLYDNKHTSGYASRRFTHLLKIAMIFSAVEGDTRTITNDHYMGALETILSSEGALPTVIRAITTTEKGSLVDSIWDVISRKRKISRVEILQNYSHRLSAEELTKIIETLHLANMITITVEGNKTYYEALD